MRPPVSAKKGTQSASPRNPGTPDALVDEVGKCPRMPSLWGRLTWEAMQPLSRCQETIEARMHSHQRVSPWAAASWLRAGSHAHDESHVIPVVQRVASPCLTVLRSPGQTPSSCRRRLRWCMRIDGHTNPSFVLGYPATQSASPGMHKAAYGTAGLKAVYLPWAAPSPRTWCGPTHPAES